MSSRRRSVPAELLAKPSRQRHIVVVRKDLARKVLMACDQQLKETEHLSTLSPERQYWFGVHKTLEILFGDPYEALSPSSSEQEEIRSLFSQACSPQQGG